MSQSGPRDLSPQFARLVGADVALRSQVENLHPAPRIAAGIVGAAGSDPSIEFFRIVAAFVASTWRAGRLRWGAGQFALYATPAYLSRKGHLPAAVFLDAALISHNASEPGAAVNFAGGIKTFANLNKEGA